MLKRKNALFILIPINVAIWGFFAYRIYNSFAASEVAEIPERTPFPISTVSLDTVKYSLNLNYEDPFLKDLKNTRRRNSNRANSLEKSPLTFRAPKIPTVKSRPDLKYHGLIKNNTTGISAALISLNGQSHLIKVNEKLEGLQFKSYNRDSLVARWGKESIVVHK